MFVASIRKMLKTINETFRSFLVLLFLLVFYSSQPSVIWSKNNDLTCDDLLATARLLLEDERRQFCFYSKKIKSEFFLGEIPLGGVALRRQVETVIQALEKSFISKKSLEKKALYFWISYYKQLLILNFLAMTYDPVLGVNTKMMKLVSIFGQLFENHGDQKIFTRQHKINFLKAAILFVVEVERLSKEEFVVERLEPFINDIQDSLPLCELDHDSLWCSVCASRKIVEGIVLNLCQKKKWEDPEVAKETKKALFMFVGIGALGLVFWKIGPFLIKKLQK
ncbi:hypothetical protein FJ366_01040 [Candidatus Dependentiae bacterium]|nr:hypothetical protein [Candidatus Dependentiae bacterium]